MSDLETEVSKVTDDKVPGGAFKPGYDPRRVVGPGRPKGSRNKLGEDFLKAMAEDFEQHGKVAIEAVRAEKPDAYLKVIASILPKQIDLSVNEFDGMSDDQLRSAVTAALRDLATLGIDLGTPASQGSSEAAQNEPAKAVFAVH